MDNDTNHQPTQEVNHPDVLYNRRSDRDDLVPAQKEAQVNQQKIEPVLAPGPGRPRSKGPVTAATKKNISLRELVMEQAATDLREQLSLTPEAIEVSVLLRDWFTKYWNPIDKRRLLEVFVETVNQIVAEDPADGSPERT